MKTTLILALIGIMIILQGGKSIPLPDNTIVVFEDVKCGVIYTMQGEKIQAIPMELIMGIGPTKEAEKEPEPEM